MADGVRLAATLYLPETTGPWPALVEAYPYRKDDISIWPDDYRRLGDLLDRIGLERTAISAMGDPAMNLIAADMATRRRGIDYMKWAVECTAALGATTLSGPLHSTLGGFSGSGLVEADGIRASGRTRESAHLRNLKRADAAVPSRNVSVNSRHDFFHDLSVFQLNV